MLATVEEVDSIEQAWNASGNALTCESAIIPCRNQAAIMVLWTKCCDRTRKRYYCIKCYNGYLPKKKGFCPACKAVCEILYVCPVK